MAPRHLGMLAPQHRLNELPSWYFGCLAFSLMLLFNSVEINKCWMLLQQYASTRS
jgi:hypothetical protein